MNSAKPVTNNLSFKIIQVLSIDDVLSSLSLSFSLDARYVYDERAPGCVHFCAKSSFQIINNAIGPFMLALTFAFNDTIVLSKSQKFSHHEQRIWLRSVSKQTSGRSAA